MRRLQLAARGLQALLRAGGSNWMPAAGGVQLQGPQEGGQAAAAAALAAAGAAASAGHWALAEEAQGPVSVPPEQATRPKANEATAQWRIYTDVGRDLVAQGRHAEAERYFKKAVEMARAGFGPDDAHVASALNNLAEFHRIRGQYDEAEPLYRQALQILVKEYGASDARVAFALHNLGGFYLLRKKLDQAAEAYEEALKVKLEVLGPGHSETSNTLFHLAEVRWRQDRKADAAALLQQSLDIMEGQGVGATSGCLRRRARLAEMRLDMGELDAAEALFRAILGYVETAQGVDDANTATAAENLAMALKKKGDYEEARRLMQRALDARQEHVGPKHPVVAVTLRRMAELELAEAAAPAARAGAGGGTGQLAALHALDLAQQACGVAQEALDSALSSTPQQRGGGLAAWLRRSSNDAALLRHQRQPADLAALELAACWRTLSRALAAAGRDDGTVVEPIVRAVTLLTEGWPVPAAGLQAAAAAAGTTAEGEEQLAEPGTSGTEASAKGPVQGSSGGWASPSAVGSSGGTAAGSKEAAAAAAAAAVARREAARRAKVEALRQEAVCTTLRELAAALLRQGRAGEVQHVQMRLQGLACGQDP